jgi:hypothetical protein
VVAAAAGRGRTLLAERGYRAVLLATGAFLIIFGLYYLFSVMAA